MTQVQHSLEEEGTVLGRKTLRPHQQSDKGSARFDGKSPHEGGPLQESYFRQEGMGSGTHAMLSQLAEAGRSVALV